jgi:uroporphyrinogen-III decarboxylase
MTTNQWEELLSVINGEKKNTKTIGFIIDSPWLPGWAGVSLLDYFTSDDAWWFANKKAADTFPEVIFLPGFWSEYGMCTEPSAFGAKLIWHTCNPPHAGKIIHTPGDIALIPQPDVKTDGLLPFMINRLKKLEPMIMRNGHMLKFAVTRGPLNIASFLMGTTEFMTLLALEPGKAHQLLEKITCFICDWISYQKECFPSIEGILLLDDISGFLGENDFIEFVLPYVGRAFNCIHVSVRFFHNDAAGVVCSPFLKEMGVNLFNFSYNHPINQIHELAGEQVALLGNLPPRDILAAGSPEEIYIATQKMMNTANCAARIIWSCGGGMPQNVPSANIKAFIVAVEEYDLNQKK